MESRDVPENLGEYLVTLSGGNQDEMATACGFCGRRAVLFNPANVVVQCHSCGSQLPPTHTNELTRQRHLYNYVVGAASRMGLDRPHDEVEKLRDKVIEQVGHYVELEEGNRSEIDKIEDACRELREAEGSS